MHRLQAGQARSNYGSSTCENPAKPPQNQGGCCENDQMLDHNHGFVLSWNAGKTSPPYLWRNLGFLLNEIFDEALYALPGNFNGITLLFGGGDRSF